MDQLSGDSHKADQLHKYAYVPYHPLMRSRLRALVDPKSNLGGKARS